MATDTCMAEALRAVDQLARKGVNTAVANVLTLKSTNRDAVECYTHSTGTIVTAEDHNTYNGLDGAVAEVVAGTYPVSLGWIGVLDRFSRVGTMDYLREIYRLDAKTIYEKT